MDAETIDVCPCTGFTIGEYKRITGQGQRWFVTQILRNRVTLEWVEPAEEGPWLVNSGGDVRLV